MADRPWNVIVAPWHVDEHIAAFPVPEKAEIVRPALTTGTVAGRMGRLHRAIADAAARAERPLLLSGDCPSARAVIAGVRRRGPDPAVLWLDAHGDFNTPDISTSGYLGGMSIAMLTGRTPELFDDAFRPVPDSAVVLADARDLDPAERDALAASAVRRVAADPSAIAAALGSLGGSPVHVHLDIDIVDGAELPGLRFPSGPGPSLGRIEECLAAACATADVVSASIACAWLPERVGDPAARAAIGRLCAALGAELSWV